MSASGYFDGAIGGSAGSAAATLSILRAVSLFHFPNWPISLRDLPGTFLIESPKPQMVDRRAYRTGRSACAG